MLPKIKLKGSVSAQRARAVATPSTAPSVSPVTPRSQPVTPVTHLHTLHTLQRPAGGSMLS